MKFIDLTKNMVNITEGINYSARTPYSISVINTEKNGKRITLSSSLYQELEKPNKMNIFLDENTIILVLAETGPTVSKKGRCIYCTKIVEDITKKFNLDYSNVTSHSFSAKLENDEETNQKFAIVKIQ